MYQVDLAYIINPSWNITCQEVNLFIKNKTRFKTRLPPKENPTHDSLVRYTSYDPTQGDRIKIYASDLPFPDIHMYRLQRQVHPIPKGNPYPNIFVLDQHHSHPSRLVSITNSPALPSYACLATDRPSTNKWKQCKGHFSIKIDSKSTTVI